MLTKINITLGVVSLFILDRLGKYLTLLLPEGEFFKWQQIFSWEKNFNDGIAFSIPLPNILSVILSFLIIIVLLDILLVKFQSSQPTTIIALQLIIAGAISNFIDRLIWGQVIDYWLLLFFPIFNLADLLIITGALLLIFSLLRHNKI
ncbi:MAG: signal peptidase II [Candidatus Komeilibacteria bacterium CG_4_10_14_0_2_um_filter_37_10]|uniref:Lipoprotein signal peptidase n=1 Tax=Candidatus Komeilibacteria bacterium CG_4_10_14_0_2_um_filter_37_10 TaxID=1974470 RepID=A0A2M7VEK8_9BACT|nr:MAG: signal peptidase II [Candidatus Komeilibacteria bacterium CG_4_10_14_0_2_um_filter_37_10]